jgi:transcriptional regulator with XRE-family HTH domain
MEIEHKTAFGERLRNLRKSQCLSQIEMAKLLNFKTSVSVSNIESNKTPPDLQTLIKIGEIFKTDLHWLITGNPTPSSEQQEKNYQRIFAALGKHISWSIAFLLGEREAREEDILGIQERINKGDNDADPNLIDVLNDEINDIQQHLSELVKLQPEMQKILADLLTKKP